MDKKRLQINLDELCSAMEDSSYEHVYYLDSEMGEILFVSDYTANEETERLKNRIEEGYGCYEQIPKAEPHESYEDVEDFITTVEDERLAELLGVDIGGEGAFRRFKDVLARYLEERERWFRFKDKRIEQRASKWLDGIGVSLVEE